MKISAFLKNMPLRHKLIAVFVPLIMVPLIVLGAVSNQISSQAIIRSTIQNTYNESGLIAGRIDAILDGAEDKADVIARNINVIYDRQSPPEPSDPIVRLQRQMDFRDQIMSELAFALSPDIDALTFIDNTNEIYCTNRVPEDLRSRLICDKHIAAVDATDGRNTWFPMKQYTCIFGSMDEPVIYIGKKIVDTYSAKKLGILFISVKESTLRSAYRTFAPIPEKEYYIVDDAGTIVSTDKNHLMLTAIDAGRMRIFMNSSREAGEFTDASGNDILLTSVPIRRMNWYLVSEIQRSRITADAVTVTQIITVVGLMCLLGALLGARLLSRIVTRPILQLTERMKRMQDGIFDIGPPAHGTDEIGLLTGGFNDMAVRIKTLLESIEQEQSKKREYELALMQSQIKPHFLYNTLYLIYILCKRSKCVDGMRATKALSDFYRIALSSGNEIIPLREELKNIESYLAIQKIRYVEIFDYQINMDEGILDCTIPKLTIQPLVENAIYHGLKPAERRGLLQIEGFMGGGSIRIRVIDDGVGIAPEKIASLLEPPIEGDTHFGVRNVHERIQLYFGPEYGLQIESRADGGTAVTLGIPSVPAPKNERSNSQ